MLSDMLSYGMFPAQGQQVMHQYQQMRNIRLLDPERQLRDASGPRGHMGVGAGNNPWFAQMGQLGNQPDYSGFTYDPQANQAATSALSQYGLSPLNPSQVNPNAILPNSGYFGRHQGVARWIEGGIFGAATSRPANTIGEGITSVAQSMIEGPRARAGLINQQFARPFQEAQMLESLKDSQQKRELTEADIQWRRAEAHKAMQDPFPKFSGHMAMDDGSVYAFDQQGTPKQMMPPGSVSKPDRHLTPEEQSLEALRKQNGGKDLTSDQINTNHSVWTEKVPRPPADHAGNMKVVIPDGKGGYQYKELPSGSPIPQGAQSVTNFDNATKNETDKEEKFMTKLSTMNAAQQVRFYRDKGLKSGDMAGLRSWYRKNIANIDGDGNVNPAASTPSPMGGSPTGAPGPNPFVTKR